MPTWLDEWCIGLARERYQVFIAAGTHLDDACQYDGLAASELTLIAMSEPACEVDPIRGTRDRWN